MNLRWSLDELYKSFDSENFESDFEKCFSYIESIRKWVGDNLTDTDNAATKIEEYLKILIDFHGLFSRVGSFAGLTHSVEAKNHKALQIIEKLEEKATGLAEPQVAFQKWLGSVENLPDIISTSPFLEEHRFFLNETVKRNKYMLSEKEEVLYAKLRNTGSNAWGKLQEFLTSTLLVDIDLNGEEKKLPLPVIRNMSHDKDTNIRKKAYEAELKSYDKIKDSSAACLNGIKGEVISMSKVRGYESILEKTLIDSRMDRETLDAMLTAIREALPSFHKYYRKKAQLLGYENGLPFFELFAPMGDSDMRFTYDEAKDLIVRNFRTFSNRLADFANNAFEKRWIDAEPREGKQGGAFCSNLQAIGESRILANFSGSFGDVTTLAHELGHGYHGYCLGDQTLLNTGYPMPIAETASIFCETIIKNAALKTASGEEAFTILESDIADAGQVIVDIYSRFLFESELFKRRLEGSLPSDELCSIMLNAQKEAYGNGLDHNYLHPYMWACKPHYYYADCNYYNFPYAFGLLFAKGLYAQYLKRGEAFIGEYDKLLAATGKSNIPDVASMAGIDVRSVDYWRSALKLVEEDIERFISLYK